jgi:hypothetical protein
MTQTWLLIEEDSMKKGLSVAIALLVVGIAAQVAAECAWVLWKESELSIYGKDGYHSKWWEIQNSYSTHEACMQAQIRVWEVVGGSAMAESALVSGRSKKSRHLC